MIRLSGGAAALALWACASVPDGSARARPRRQALRSAGRPGAAVRLPRRDVRRGDQADGARRRPARRRHRAAYVPARPCHGGSASSRLHKSEKDSTIEFTAQNGNAYFVWQEIKMGVFAARSELHLMSPPEGRNAVATCSLAEPPPGLRYPLAALDPKPAGGPDTIKYEADRVCIRWTRVTFPDSGCYQLVRGARALRLAWPRQRARNPSICPRVARS